MTLVGTTISLWAIDRTPKMPTLFPKCNFGHYFLLDQTAQNSPNSDEIFETILFIFKRVRFKAEIVIYKWQGGFGDASSWKHKHHWPWWTDTRDSLLIHFHLKSNLDKTFVVTNVKILNWGQNCCRPRPEHVPSLTTDLDSRFWGFCLLRYLSPQHIRFHCKHGWCLRSKTHAINIIMTHGIVWKRGWGTWQAKPLTKSKSSVISALSSQPTDQLSQARLLCIE